LDTFKGMERRGRRLAKHFDVIDDEMAEVIRAKSGAERLRIASDMYSSARQMLLSHLGTAHPDWDEQRLQLEAARRLSHGAV